MWIWDFFLGLVSLLGYAAIIGVMVVVMFTVPLLVVMAVINCLSWFMEKFFRR